MARVAVLHNTLDHRGGADAVCLRVCEALQDAHEVTLVTLSRSSLDALNDLFDASAAVAVERPPGTALLCRAFDAVADRAGPQLAARSALLTHAFSGAGFDAAVSTANEFSLPVPSVQYVHFPQFNRAALPADHPVDAGRLNGVWSRLAGLDDRRLPADATLLANSGWTADAVEHVYGRRPTVVHPPVDAPPDPRPWAEREAGVVTLGRVAPDKRPLRAIRVVDGVRARGHDLHLHLVGSASPTNRRYVRRVADAAAERAYVHLALDAPRRRVERLLETHRYGLNCKPDEHFGMAVAEYVAAGMVAFAPDSGGQREILDGDRLFDGVEDAVDTVARAVAGGETPSPSRTFGGDGFAAAVRTHVDAVLDGG